MFIDFTTNKGEHVALNVDRILFITEKKNGCLIYDTEGMDYTVSESYSDFVSRLNSKCVQKV